MQNPNIKFVSSIAHIPFDSGAGAWTRLADARSLKALITHEPMELPARFRDALEGGEGHADSER